MKLPSKKLSIISLSAVAVLATGAISYATLTNQPEPVVEQSVSRVEQTPEPVKTVEATPVEAAPTPVEQAPAPTPVVENKYPYATFNGQWWVITDKTGLLTQAGVGEAEQKYATLAIRDWYFTEDGSMSISNCVQTGKAQYGSITTPVDQVRTLDSYVKIRYGSWEKAYNTFGKSGDF